MDARNARARNRRASDPAYAEKYRAYMRAYSKQRKADDQDYVEYMQKAQRDHRRRERANDSAAVNRKWVEWAHRKKASSEEWRLMRTRKAEATRTKKLWDRYGFNIEKYEALLAEQHGLCAICLKPETFENNGSVHRLCVDHDHTDNSVRGLLCKKCNMALGNMLDDPALLRKAANYLVNHKRKHLRVAW